MYKDFTPRTRVDLFFLVLLLLFLFFSASQERSDSVREREGKKRAGRATVLYWSDE